MPAEMRAPMGAVLRDMVGPDSGLGLVLKNLVLVALGVAALTIAAKVQVPTWPVPTTMQAFVVLVLGAAYGARLGMATVLSYLAAGAAGFPVFAAGGGLAYFAGPTAGYLVGFVLAAGVVGALAERGWDRGVVSMAGAMILGLGALYVPGAAWMVALFGAEKAWTWGVHPFLWIDLAKAALATLIFPAIWSLVGR